ncbi:hypothetical protein CEXT_376541, partial [Caerostris extrusa]
LTLVLFNRSNSICYLFDKEKRNLRYSIMLQN